VNQITCSDCGTTFEFSDSEQAFYASKQLTPPKRCKACRDLKRSSFGAKKGGARSESGSRYGRDSRNGPPRDRGDRSFRGSRENERPGRDAPRKRFSGTPVPEHSAPRPPAEQLPPKRESAKKAARPMFDMVCASCGVSSQVPFEPAPDREIFCQPCYRSRRKPDTATLEGATIPADESGIIE